LAEAVLIYITHDDRAKAKELGRALVEERLVACVNLLGPMTPIYRWEGEICEGEEVVIIAKTRASLVAEVTSFVRERHGYDCPCVVALPVVDGNPDYLRWIEQETREPLGQTVVSSP